MPTRPRPRRGRGARALHLRGARGADRRQARRTEPRPAREPDPRPRPERPGLSGIGAVSSPRSRHRRRQRSRTCCPGRPRSPPPPAARSTATPAASPASGPSSGPAFVAAVAYIDPGNFATNVTGGAKFGYLLLWVVLAANLIAMVVQTQSAKLGSRPAKPRRALPRDASRAAPRSASGCRPRWWRWPADLAEIVGAALGLNLLFGIPLFFAGLIAGVGRLRDARLAADAASAGSRRRSAPWSGSSSPPSPSSSLTPRPTAAKSPATSSFPALPATESILLATGIIGATVMPHVIYLHSALTQRRIVGRNDDERRRILRFEKIDVVIAMALAGLVNLAMMIVAAALFHGSGLTGIETIEGAYHGAWTLVSTRSAPRRSSGSPCSPPASPPPRSGRWPARW